MEVGRRNRSWWLLAVVAAVVFWLLGAYLPAVSNVWVMLNILTPAGQPGAATLPLAYPAVGVDPRTVVSLLGLLLVIGATVRWMTYLRKAEPEATPVGVLASRPNPAGPPSGPANAARPTSERPVS